MIAVLIPTFGRADRLARVAANITENTETDHRVVFAVEAEDVESIAAAAELDVDVVVNEGRPNYSGRSRRRTGPLRPSTCSPAPTT